MTDDEEGAAAFVQFYFASQGEAERTGDTSQFETLHTTGCAPCAEVVRLTLEIRNEDGLVFDKNPYKTSIRFSQVVGEGKARVAFTLSVAPYNQVDKGGDGVRRKSSSSTYQGTAQLTREDGRWAVSDWVQEV